MIGLGEGRKFGRREVGLLVTIEVLVWKRKKDRQEHGDSAKSRRAGEGETKTQSEGEKGRRAGQRSPLNTKRREAA